MAGTDGQRGSTQVERWIDHIVRAVTVVAIIGGFNMFSSMRTDLAVFATELRAVSARLDDMRDAAQDRYTGSDARRDITPLLDRLNDHEGRLRALERGGPIRGQ